MTSQIRYHQLLVSPDIGGAEKLAVEIHKFSVTARGAVSRLLVPPGGGCEVLVRSEAFPFAPYHLTGLLSGNRLRSTFANLDLVRRMAGFRSPVVHVHSPFVYGATRLFRRTTSVKTVLHIHLDYSLEQLHWPLAVPPDLILVCARSVLPVVNEALAGIPASKRPRVRVLQNAVDMGRYFPTDRHRMKQRLGFDPHVPLILMVANLAKHKGQETALRSVAALKRRGQFVKLVLVGEERGGGTSFATYLRTLTRELAVGDRVDFSGFRDDVPDLLRAADFALLPSTSEALPLIVLEAQATKVVVLAAPTADIPFLIEDGKTGHLVAADDPEGYASRIAGLLSNHSQMEALTDNAFRQVSEQFQLKDYCKAVLDEYDNLHTSAADTSP